MRIVMALLVVAACGASSAEIKTAKTATYNAQPDKILQLAIEVARESYKVGAVDPAKHVFATEPRMYSREGGLEGQGAEGWVRAREGSVLVQLVVEIVETGGRVAVSVTPHTLQMVAGSPQPRELKPDDPYLPQFVVGRADALAVAIYERAKQLASP
jgi:hypothetical protein